MERIVLAFIGFFLLKFGDSNRFRREELGVPDRLRFTSGQNPFYECDIIEKRLVSQLKIGLHIYDHKSIVLFSINDTSFTVTSQKVENFYFAHVSIKQLDKLNEKHFLKLVAKDAAGVFIDETILKINSPNVLLGSAPVFLNDTITKLDVTDDTFVGSCVGKLAVVNQYVPVTFYLKTSDIESIKEFSLTSDGRIIVTKRLNSAKHGAIEFKAFARHATYLEHTSHITLRININRGKSTVKPTLRKFYTTSLNKAGYSINKANSTYTFHLSELAPKHTIVGCVWRKVQYGVTFAIHKGNEDNAFDIDSLTGIISVRDESKIDYEYKKKSILTIIANVKKTTNFPIEVNINIIDENDNTPTFNSSQFSVTILENLRVGAPVIHLQAKDKDSGSNGIVSYILDNKTPEPFSFKNDGTLIVSGSLDLIIGQSYYYLYVKALDAGYPIRRESETLVKVSVKSVNAHEPVLKYLTCNVVVNSKSSKEVMKLESVDKDLDNTITYGMDIHYDYFDINQTSGTISMKQLPPVDKTLEIHVYAFDGLYKSNPTKLSITLKDAKRSVNCQPNSDFIISKKLIDQRKQLPNPTKKPSSRERPVSPLVFMKTPGSVLYLSETTKINTVLGHYQAKNPNIKSYGLILYTITRGNFKGKFQIDMMNGVLSLRDTLRKDTNSSYLLEIQASDGDGLKVVSNLYVKIDGADDRPPVFDNNGKYEVKLTETKSIGNVSLTVKARMPVELCIDVNCEVVYSLVNPSSLFEIDPKTGLFRVASTLAKQPFKEYFVEIQAFNRMASKPTFGYALIHVTVIGTTNRPPICLSNEQRIEVPTSTPHGAVIGRVIAYDVDEGKAGKITYAVKNKDKDFVYFDHYFSLNKKSGLLTLKRELSKQEKGEKFKILVEVSDQGRPSLSTTCHVYKIIVDGSGVSRPNFALRNYPITTFIPFNSSRGTYVTKLTASLPGNEVDDIRYALVDGSGIGLFSIDNVLGSIYVSESSMIMPFYWLTVQAYLAREPSNYRNTHVIVEVHDKQHRKVFFNPSVYHVDLEYTEEEERFIVQLYATDGTGRYNLEKFKYGIFTGDKKEMFTIDDKGWLKSKDVLDVGRYRLNVTVLNPKNVSAISYGNVVVNIKAHYSEAPSFISTSSNYKAIRVFETTRTGFQPPYLFQTLALNPNSEEKLIYEDIFESGFIIDRHTAVVKTKQNLNAGQSKFLNVKVTNLAGRSSSIFYTVLVGERPNIKTSIAFRLKVYELILKENVLDGIVIDFSSEIITSHNEFPIYFYILSGNDGLNFLFPATDASSKLRIVTPLDHERKPFHRLEILAFDGSSYDTCKVKITVQNSNDNHLTASQTCYEARIPENQLNIDQLISVKVTDPDEVLPGLKYSMVNNERSSPFLINQNGVIVVDIGVKFDREKQDEYILTAMGGFDQENATYCVNVFIEDANDHKPNFTRNMYDIELLDSTPVGTSVMAVYATDKDAGSNSRLSYSLQNDNEHFGIGSSTGILYTKKRLNELSNTTSMIQVVVVDHGKKPFSSTTKIKISVLFDTRRLTFSQPSYTFFLLENLPRATLVSDATKINVSKVYYEIHGKAPDDCSRRFWIDSFTGTILTADVLDAEEFRECTFDVHGLIRGRIVSSAIVLVKVVDINDNQPTFKETALEGVVKESQNSNTEVLSLDGSTLVVSAEDEDDGPNGDVRYTFLKEMIGIYFNIDEKTGVIKTNMVLDCEKHPNVFEFDVRATDRGALFSLSSTIHVKIHLQNINDRIPEFVDLKVLLLQMPAYQGMIVGKLHAKDYDVEPEELRYSMADQSGVFDVHEVTGEIFVKNPTGLTNQRMMRVQAKVSDSQFHSVVMVQIQIAKYTEDETFKFVPPLITKSVMEIEENKQPVGIINPIGYEIGEQIHFRILNPIPEFKIGKVSGILRVSPDTIFDREKIAFYEVHVEAWKVNNPSMIARMLVNFTVTDVNDNYPVFIQKRFYKAIDIDNNVGAELMSVSAKDADAGENARLRYSVIGGDGVSYFSCHPDKGIITLKKKFIKSQASRKYSLQIRASDHGETPLFSDASIEIYLTNKDQPMFVSNYFGKVAEDSPIGDTVLKVVAKGRNNRQVYYEIVDGDDYEQFHVGFTSGEVIVAALLDYLKKSVYSMKIRAIDSLTGSWSDTNCEVTVFDVNNHHPVFESAYYKTDVSENTVQGSSILKVSAHDHDSGANGEITYSITPLTDENTDSFTVNKATGEINLSAMLDAEIKRKHRIQVTATDNGNPKKSSFTFVEVNVLDENDNEPVFLASSYAFFFHRYKDEAHYLGQVHAFDGDISDKLTYSVAPQSKYVFVEGETGSVYLKVDMGTLDQTKVMIFVSDGFNTASVEAIITRTGANQHAPKLTSVTVFVNENDAANPTLVTKLKAEDPDIGRYGEVSFFMDTTHFSQYFNLHEDGSLFTTGVIFDREAVDAFVIPVRAVDGGGLFSLANINVIVEDVNDNTPNFEFSLYETNVMTSQVTAESLVHAIAIDEDYGMNSELKYVAHGLDDNSPILVDNTTGLISLAGFPKGSKYQFSVQVSDNGYPILQSRASVQISVRSWNHHILVFLNRSYVVEIGENAVKNTFLTEVQAKLQNYDGDINYELIDGNLPHTKASGLFKIDSKDGKIWLEGELDYEKIRTYKLLVKAKAHDLDSTNCFVHVNILNVNDNPPKFDSKMMTIRVSENTPIGTQIIRAFARDLDDPYGKHLRYRIKDDRSNFFEIDSESGWVKVKKGLDREKEERHELTIEVTDSTGGDSTIRSDEQKLIIILIDTNDWSPAFTENQYSFTVLEDAIVSHLIGSVDTRDMDSNSTIRYYFHPDQNTNKHFALNSISGDLTLLRQLNAKTYIFQVIAYDGVNMNSVQVTINVQEVNDQPPICLNSFYQVSVKEDLPVGEPLVRIQAKGGDNDDALIYLIQGEGISKFSVDGNSGFLKASKPLDYEVKPKENFKIVVTDQTGHSCDSDVFLNLEDVNDNAPVFDQDLHMATVRENASQSVVLAQVRATDLDSYDNHKLTYSIIKNNENQVFAINQRGIVTVNRPSLINRKKQPAYSLIIQATDNGNPRLLATTKLQVVVLSTTDIPPKFDKLGYHFNITENNKAYAVIGSIHVKASENLKHEKILVSVINDENDNFVIEKGVLKTKYVMDYESQSRYSFDVKAWYEMIPTLSSTVNVEVQITDQNDHVPIFKEKSFNKRIDENVRPGIFFFQVLAEDGDGSRKNSLVHYKIIGDPGLPFAIGKQSGVVSVDGSIDHEVKMYYKFMIEASDNGTPAFSAKVPVTVNISDLNDNAPMISDYNTSVIVQEKKKAGSELITVSMRDVDSVKNGAPFHCQLLKGDESKFEIVSIDDGTKCVLKSKDIFEKDKKDEYKIEVRVTDSGSPTQYSDCQITIIIVEESYHSPVIQDPKLFYIIVSPPYGWTKIGQVNVFDKDKSDIHQFRITEGNSEDIFQIQPLTGVIEGKPTAGTYRISVEVTDGKFTDSVLYKIVANEFSEELKIKSISIVVNGVDVPTFVDSKMVDFITLLARLSGTVSENVFIWSVHESSERPGSNRRRRANKENDPKGVILGLVVKGIQGNEYIEPSNLKSYIESSKSEFKQLNLDVSVQSAQCLNKKCPNNQQCMVTFIPKDAILSLYLPSGYMSFDREEKCYCSDGSEGPVCESNPCSHNPCKIGEKCVVTSTYFKCECMEYDKCDPTVDTITLSGASYVSYQLRKSFDELFTTLSMSFRTEATSTEYLFYAYGKDFFILEIDRSGHIKVRFDFGSGVGFAAIEGRKVNDGNWHHVHVERYGNYVAMVLDKMDSSKKEARAPGNSAKININGHGIQIGAGLSHDGKPFSGFKGCIKEPKLNNQRLPFSGNNDIVLSVDAHKVDPECKDSGRCSKDKCPRFSDCINTLSSFQCPCLPGHYGSQCKSKLTCKDNPCKNRGTCTYEEGPDGTVSYKCTCRQGFTGGQCHISLGPCATRPCLNGGKCLAINDNTYACQCAVGFTGKKCSINKYPCSSNPCRNGGTCRNKYNDYQCICPPGKYGKQCSAGENCRFDKCLNGGTCLEKDVGSLCSCIEGYYGSRCQYDVDECLLLGNCKQSTCVNTIGDYYCNCTNGDKLKVCPIASASKAGSGIPMLYVIVGAAGGLILIIIVIVACCCCRKKRKHDPLPHDPNVKYPLNRYLPQNGEDQLAVFPPSPPPRGELLPPSYYEEPDQASAAMYDPSLVTFSGTSSPDECVKVPLKFSPTRTSVEYNSEDEEMKSLPGYHWDYSEVPEDIIIRKMSREGSRILPTKTDEYYDDDNLEYVEMPELPERPASRRSSLPGYSESEADIPELPELPQQVRLSRQSLRSSNHSPSNLQQRINPMSSSEFRHRYSLLSDENSQDTSYLHDDDAEVETMSELTRVTRPRMPSGYGRRRYESESSASDEIDGFTETSFNSDDDATEHDPLDPANTRKLERDIQKLIKDIQRRTEED